MFNLGSNIRMVNMGNRTAMFGGGGASAWTPANINFPLSDDFGGADKNSGAIGDTNWNVRFPSTSNIGSWSISSEKLITSSVGTSAETRADSTFKDQTGNFTVTAEIEGTSWGGTGGARPITLNFGWTGGSVGVGINRASGSSTTTAYYYNGSTDGNVAMTGESLTARIRRVSGVVYLDFNDGSGWTNLWSGANTNTFNNLLIYHRNLSGSGTLTGEWDNLAALDAAGDPINIIENALWLDANDATTITEDVGVSQWDDKSTVGTRHVAQASGANQPAYTGGKVVFDGINDELGYVGGATDTQPSMIFAVAKYDSAGGFVFDGQVFGSRFILYESATNKFAMFAGVELGGSAADTVEHVFGAYYNTTSSTLYLDGTSIASGTSGTTSNSGVTIGNAYDSSQPFNGKISEVVMVGGTVDTDTRQKIEGYLAWKWDTINGNSAIRSALPADHPYKYDGSLFGYSETQLLLDADPADHAYSVARILREDYAGSAIRVREDGLNTELDIGFDASGDLDVAAIVAHCGSNNGYVVTVYDQQASADVTQASASLQPKIYDGTTGILTSNGKPSMWFETTSTRLVASNVTVMSDKRHSTFVVEELTDVTKGSYPLSAYPNINWAISLLAVIPDQVLFDGSWRFASLQDVSINTQYVYSMIRDTNTTLKSRLNGVARGGVCGDVSNPTSTAWAIGNHISFAANNDFWITEIVHYASNKFDSRDAIEENMNNYYGAY